MKEYALAHPWLTFWMVLFFTAIAGEVALKLPNRLMRHWNIRKHGYPPPHCDADGDPTKNGTEVQK